MVNTLFEFLRPARASEFRPVWASELVFSIGLIFAMAFSTSAASAQQDVWFGTTTSQGGLSRGIYFAQLDAATGTLTGGTLAAEVDSPGWLTIHPRLDVLYSTGNLAGEPSVLAWAIRRRSEGAELERIGSVAVGDGGATHLAVDRSGTFLLSAQYGGGSTALFVLDSDGNVTRRAQLVGHQGGSGVVADRQDAPHAHWVGTSPDNRFVFVPDLGLDQVVIYRLDREQGKLLPHGFGQVPPGSGPRHMKFSPDGQFAFVLNELALSVTTFRYDATEGKLEPVQTVPMLTADEKQASWFVSGSEIRVHPTGRFVYAASRGHDSVTVFAFEPGSGQLTRIQNEPIRGSWPRNFGLDLTGRWLLAAGRDSHSIAVFSIDSDNGSLTFTGKSLFVPSPICVLVTSPKGIDSN